MMTDNKTASEVKAQIDRIIVRENCVLSFDRNLIELLPDILAENHGVTGPAAVAFPPAARLFELLDPEGKLPRQVERLPPLITASGADLSPYETHEKSARVEEQAQSFDKWTKESASQSVDAVVSLQKDLGMGAHNARSGRYDARRQNVELKGYLRSVTTPPPSFWERLARKSFWEIKLGRWMSSGMLTGTEPSLSVGPRWVTEIEFFREITGLKRHIGLDLFSDDTDLVKVGDMHAMPFGDGQFQFMFLKNVVDKSYEIRKLVSEIIRVMRPGGIVVVDQICGYGCTTPLTRTDLQSAHNLKRIFERRCKAEVLVCEDVDISGVGDAAASGARRYNARLALRVG